MTDPPKDRRILGLFTDGHWHVCWWAKPGRDYAWHWCIEGRWTPEWELVDWRELPDA